MFKVVIKTTDKTGIVRADIISYKAVANIFPSFTTNPNGMYYSSASHASQPKPIKDYTVTLYTTNGNTILVSVGNEHSLNEFIDKLVMAEEEQMTSSSISMEELYQYAAEKILGNKHESFPGIKLSVIEVDGTIIDDNNLEIKNYNQADWNGATSTKGGLQYGL